MGTLLEDCQRALSDHLAATPDTPRNADERQAVSDAIDLMADLAEATPETVVVVMRGGVCDAVLMPKGGRCILLDWDNLQNIGDKPERAIVQAANAGRYDAIGGGDTEREPQRQPAGTVTFEREYTMDALAADVAAYAIAVDEAVCVSVEPDEDGWAIRVDVDLSKEHGLRDTAIKAAADRYDGRWNWVHLGALSDANELVGEWKAIQEERFAGLVIVGP